MHFRGAIFLILFCVYITLSAKPNHSGDTIRDHDLTSDTLKQDLVLSLSDAPSVRASDVFLLSPTNLSILRRGFEIDGEGWSTYVEFLHIFDPIQPAARALEQFYEAVLEDIKFGSGNTPEGKLCLTFRGLSLGFRCLGGRLSWELVRVAVRALLEATQQGFAGEFRSEWVHDASGVIIQIGLVVVDDAVKRILLGDSLARMLPVACQLRT